MMGYTLTINKNMIDQKRFIKYILVRRHTYEDFMFFDDCKHQKQDLLEMYKKRFGVDPIDDLLSLLTLDDTLIYKDNAIIWPMSRPFEVMDEDRNIDYFTMHNIFNKLQTVLYGNKKFDIFYYKH